MTFFAIWTKWGVVSDNLVRQKLPNKVAWFCCQPTWTEIMVIVKSWVKRRVPAAAVPHAHAPWFHWRQIHATVTFRSVTSTVPRWLVKLRLREKRSACRRVEGKTRVQVSRNKAPRPPCLIPASVLYWARNYYLLWVAWSWMKKIAFSCLL